MKKLIFIFSLMLVIAGVKAQQTTGTATGSPENSTTVTGVAGDKQCHGINKDCPIPCTSSNKKCTASSKDCSTHCESSKVSSTSSSTGNMSAEYTSTGAAAEPASVTGKKIDCKGKKGKSCCGGVSKASALGNTVPAQPADPK